MSAHHIEGPAVVDGAVEVYHFVIAYAIGPMAFVPMDVINLLDSHRVPFRRSRTMDYDFSYRSHA